MTHPFAIRRQAPALGLVLILAAAAWTLSAPARADLEGGAPAPNFELASLERSKPLVLHKVQGYRLLVLVRAGASLTSETMALCHRLTARLQAPKQPWLPILIWEGPLPSSADSTSISPGNSWRVGLDPESRVAQAYQMIASPTIYLVDPQGKVMYTFSGWQPTLEMRLLGVLAATLEAEPLPAPAAAPQTPSRQDRAAFYFDLGRAMAEYGTWRQALAYFERGLTFDSDAVDPLAESARSAYLSFDGDKAHVYAQRALELKPGHPLALAVLANLEGRPTTMRWQAGTSSTLSSPLLRDR